MWNRNVLTYSLVASFTLLILVELVKYFQVIDIDQTFESGCLWLVVLASFLYSLYRNNLTTWILFSMVAGIVVGVEFPEVAVHLRVLSKIFLKLIKTIIGPILFATLVVGIASHANLKQIGSMGWKSIVYFEIVTTIALAIGLIMINITQAGAGIDASKMAHDELPKTEPQTWEDIILHTFPENIAKSIYEGQVLQIVVFSLIFGVALALLPASTKKPMLDFCESLAEVMFKFTNIIMYFAPFGIGGAMAYTVGHMGIDILLNLFQLLFTLYVSLIIFLLLVLVPILLYFKIPIRKFISALKEPVSIAFATTSSESALPLLMKNMERFGVPRRTVSFVIPMGYSFNLDGTTLYLSLASIFVAQAAGHPIATGENLTLMEQIGTQLLIGLTLMLTSKGVAGVPRASLIILLGVCVTYDLPIWPVAAILGIDELMDMARTSVNVIGNATASCVIARSEKEFDDEKAHRFKAHEVEHDELY